MEQDAVLQGRQRIDIGDIRRSLRHIHAQGVDVLLLQRHQRQHDWRDGQAAGGNRVGRYRRGGGALPCTTDGLRHGRQGRRGEDMLDVERHALLAQALDQGDDGQGMATELEELVVAAHPADAKQLLPDGGDGALHVALRSLVLARHKRRLVRRRQCLAIELAVRRQREARQRHIRRRHHVVGQHGRQLLAQRGGRRLGPLLRDQVGDQALVARRILAHHHNGFLHAVAGGQAYFDLAQFDAEAAQLHLFVDAAQMGHLAVFQQLAQVARAVQALPWLPRMGNKAFRRQLFAVQVAAAQAIAADIDFTDHADRQQLLLLPEDQGAAGRDRRADIVRVGNNIAGRDALERHVHTRLGDAVHVDQGHMRVAGREILQVDGVQPLATEDYVAQGGQRQAGLALGLGDQVIEGGRRLVQHRHPFVGQQGQHGGRIAPHFLRHDGHAAAVQQRAIDLPHGKVEGAGMEQAPDIGRAEIELQTVVDQQAHHVAVLEHGALGHAGRTRGINHVGEARGAGQRCEILVRTGLRGIHRQQRQAGREQRRADVVAGDDAHGAAIVHDIGDAFGRIARVDGHVGAARLEHGKHRHQQVRRAAQAQRHHGVGAHAHRAQLVRQAVGAAVQFTVAEAGRAAADGGAVRRAFHLFLDQLMDGGFARPRGGALVPCRQLLPFLVRVQQGHAVDDGAVVVRQRLQQHLVVAHHLLHQPGIEEVGVVHQFARPLPTGVMQVQVQVVLAVAKVGFDDRGRQPARLQLLRRGIVKLEQHVEQGRAAHVLLGLERQHELVELHLLVVQAITQLALDLHQQRRQGSAGRTGVAHYQQVGQRADHVFQARRVTAGDAGAHHQLVMPGIAAQQGIERGKQHGRMAHAVAARHGLQPRREARRQREGMARGREGMHERTRAVQRQFHGLQLAAQLIAPIEQQFVAVLREERALPCCVVGVLQRQRGQLRRAPFFPGGAQFQQFLPDQLHRTAVGHRMVGADGQHAAAIRAVDEHGAQQGTSEEVEWPLARLDGARLHVARLATDMLERDGQLRIEAGDHRLAGHANTAAQHLMARDDGVERRLQHVRRRRPLPGEQQWNIMVDRAGRIQAAGFEGVDEPHAVLVGRQDLRRRAARRGRHACNGGRRHLDVAQRLQRRAFERLDQLRQRGGRVLRQLQRRDAADALGGQDEVIARIVHVQGERIVGALFGGKETHALASRDAGAIDARRRAVAVVQQGCKQRRIRRHAAAALGQRQ